jgi:hypothetical protein
VKMFVVRKRFLFQDDFFSPLLFHAFCNNAKPILDSLSCLVLSHRILASILFSSPCEDVCCPQEFSFLYCDFSLLFHAFCNNAFTRKYPTTMILLPVMFRKAFVCRCCVFGTGYGEELCAWGELGGRE